MRKAQLNLMLRGVLEDLDDQMTQVGIQAQELGVQPYQLRDMSGNFIMIPLLVAKANVIAAMVAIEK